jgi:membrane protein required for beta-lactamase induction
LAVFSWLPCSDCLFRAVLFWLSFPGYPVLAVFSWLSCFGCLFLAVLFWLAFPGYPVPTVLFWLSCSGLVSELKQELFQAV